MQKSRCSSPLMIPNWPAWCDLTQAQSVSAAGQPQLSSWAEFCQEKHPTSSVSISFTPHRGAAQKAEVQATCEPLSSAVSVIWGPYRFHSRQPWGNTWGQAEPSIKLRAPPFLQPPCWEHSSCSAMLGQYLWSARSVRTQDCWAPNNFTETEGESLPSFRQVCTKVFSLKWGISAQKKQKHCLTTPNKI